MIADEKRNDPALPLAASQTTENPAQPPSPAQPAPEPQSLDEARQVIAELRARQAELEWQNQKLRASERHYRLLTENTSDVLWMMNLDGQMTYLSPAIERVRGYTPEEALTQPLSEVFTPSSLKRFQRLWSELIPQYLNKTRDVDEVVHLEMEYRCKDGSTTWGENRIAMIADETGTPAFIVGVSRDVTERKRAEMVLHESELRLRILLSNAPVLLFATDREGTITFIDGLVLKTLGLIPDEVIGWRIQDFFPNPEAIQPDFQRVLAGENVEISGPTEGAWLDVRFTPLPGLDGRIIGTIGVVIDISERKQAEAEREKLLAALEQRNIQLQTVVEISTSASSFLDPNALMKHMVDLICERFQFYYASIFLVDEQNEYAVLRAATGESGRRLLGQRHRLPIGGNSMVGWCIANSQTRIAQDVTHEMIRFQNPLLPATRAEIALPLRNRGRCIGALSVQSTQALAFTDENVAILQTMADHLAIAIDNARLYTEAQSELNEHMRTQQALARESAVNASAAELSKSIIALKPLDEIAALVLEHAKRLTGSEFGFVGYIDTASGHLVSSTLSMPETRNQCALDNKAIVFENFTGLWGWVLRHRQPLLTNHPQNDPRSASIPAGHIPIRQFLAVPAMLGDDLVGEIALCNPEYDYSGQDLFAIERLARLYAVAVQQRRTHEAQEKLTAQLSLQSAALQAAANAIVITAQDGKITWVNPAFTRLTGYSFEEALGQSLNILKSNIQDARFYQHLWATILDGKVWQGEIINRRKDGSLYPEEITITPVLNAERRIVNFVAVKQDISERKQAETALHDYAKKQASLYAVTAAATNFLDPIDLLATTLDVVMKNAGIEVDAGWVMIPGGLPPQPPQVLVSRGIASKMLSADVLAALNECSHYDRYIQTNQPVPETELVMECHSLPDAVRLPTGLEGYLDIPIAVGQRILGFISIAWSAERPCPTIDRDLLFSLGRQIGLALRNAQLYQTARQLDRLEVLNAIGTAANSTLQLEPMLQEVLRITCQALQASDGSVLLRDLQTDELTFTLASKNTPSSLYGKRLAKGQGIAGWVVEHGQSLRVNDVAEDLRWYPGVDAALGLQTRSILCVPMIYRGQITSVLEVINKTEGEFSEEDTSLLEAIAAIISSALENARLYTTALERANELQKLYDERKATQAHLIQTEKVAALGRLTASIAHEINNPLQAIQGCLNLLREEINGAQRKEKLTRYLGIVNSEIERVATIVRRMRDFYRPSREQIQPTHIPVVIGNVLDLSAKQLQHSKIVVKRTWEENIPMIPANPDMLNQVFLNLVLNAIDAMPEGGTLHITIRQGQDPSQPEPQPVVQIEFRDTGKGMSSQTLNHLFEPFFTTKEQGTGLGLYISHRIITSHNGKVLVSSEPGRGSCFTILLPIPVV